MALYIGNHEASDTWLDRNAGLTLSFDPKTQEMRLINLPEIPTKSNFSGGQPTLDERPFFRRIEGVDWDALVPDFALRFGLLAISEAQSDDEQWEFLARFQDQNAELAATLIAALKHIKQVACPRK